jgi:hypothetical protein
MIIIDDLWTAVNRAYEELAMLQLDIAKKTRVSGDIKIFNRKHMESIKLYAYINAIHDIPFNISIEENKKLEQVYNRIKTITKDLRRWD